MEVKEGGIVIIKGDNIENGGLKIIHNYGKEKLVNDPLTKETLKEKVDIVINRINNGRLWFPVCKFDLWVILQGETPPIVL